MNCCGVRHKYEWARIAPYFSDKFVVRVLMYITMVNELEDPDPDQWINGLKHLHRNGGFLRSLKPYAMSHCKNGIISLLRNKFSTDHC